MMRRLALTIGGAAIRVARLDDEAFRRREYPTLIYRPLSQGARLDISEEDADALAAALEAAPEGHEGSYARRWARRIRLALKGLDAAYDDDRPAWAEQDIMGRRPRIALQWGRRR